MPAVGRLDEKSFKKFLEHSDYFKLVKYDNQFNEAPNKIKKL